MPSGKPKPESPRMTFSKWFRENVKARPPSRASVQRADQLYAEFKQEFEAAKTEAERRKAAGKFPVIFEWVFFERYFGPIFGFLSSSLRFSGNEHVLSLGSGEGIFENYIASHRVPNGRVTCVDFVHEKNRFAANLAAKSHAKNLSTVTADVRQLPVNSDSQNFVLMLGPGLNPDYFKTVLGEVYRVIKKSGDSRFILSHNPRYPDEINQISAVTKDAGFELLNFKVLDIGGGRISFSVFSPKIRHSK